MKKLVLPTVLAMTLASGVAAFAENSPATRLSLKGLDGIGVRVQQIPPTDRGVGLSKKGLQAIVEQRIRKAKIPILTPQQQDIKPQRPCLVVDVATLKLDTGEYLYSIHVEVAQWVASLADPNLKVTAAVPVPARTWSPGNVFGIAPANHLARDAQQTVIKMVDEFVDAYFRANPSETAFQARSRTRLR